MDQKLGLSGKERKVLLMNRYDDVAISTWFKKRNDDLCKGKGKVREVRLKRYGCVE